MLRTTSLVAASSVASYEMYVSMIPNGANVPGVDALGHVNPEGDGTRNGFGEDFASVLYVWTKEMCEKDSDGDGQTNGQELGDPCCEWDLLDASARWTVGVSHPGNASDTADESLWAAIECNSSSSSSASAAQDQTTSSSSASLSGSTSTAATNTAAAVASAIAAVVSVLLV